MKASFKKPYADKGYSIQFTEVNESERLKIHGMMNMTLADIPDEWRDAKPFLQGDSDGWMMVEFWTKDLSAITDGISYVENKLGIEVELEDWRI